MTERFVKGKRRTETPRLKDLPAVLVQQAADSDGNRSENHDAAGRFARGNRAALGQGIKALIRKGLGDPADPATGALVREATRLYLALLRSLPSDGPGVRQLAAAQARHAMLATHYANEAAKAGLATKLGLELAEASRAHDTTAQRLSVTAYDRAVREAAARPKPNPLAWLTESADEPADGTTEQPAEGSSS